MAKERAFFSSSPKKRTRVPVKKFTIPRLPTVKEHKVERTRKKAAETIANTSPEDREKLGLNMSRSEVKALVKRNEEFLRAKGME